MDAEDAEDDGGGYGAMPRDIVAVRPLRWKLKAEFRVTEWSCVECLLLL